MARLNRIVAAVVWLGLVGCIPAFGQFVSIAYPIPAYTGSTTVIPITVTDGTSVPSLTDGTQTITFSTALHAATVPTSWQTWGSPPYTESSTPRVLTDFGATSLTLTLSVPAHTLGFEIESDAFAIVPFTANFYSGGTLLGTVSITVNGHAGALLAGGSDRATITSVVVTTTAAAGGFAMAQLRYGSVSLVGTPAPSSIFTGGLGMLLLAAGALLARARRSAEA
ncbi:MAG: hypothetical protein WCB12_18920 [Bryobacteraceae bacterium]